MLDTKVFEMDIKRLHTKITEEQYQIYTDYGIEFGNIIYKSFIKLDKHDQIFQMLGLLDKEPLIYLDQNLITNNINLINKTELLNKLNEIDNDERTNYIFYGLYMLYNELFIKIVFSLLDYNTDIILNTLKQCENRLKHSINKNQKTKFKMIFLNKVTYPKELTPIGYMTFDDFNIKRNIMPNNCETGMLYTVKNDEPLIYESGLEKKILEQLIEMDEIIRIKTQSIAIPYIGINNKTYNYYPDIQVLTEDDKIIIIEVKPIMEMQDIRVIKKYKILKDYCIRNGYGYIMLDQNIIPFEELINKSIDIEKEEKFVNYVKNNTPLNIISYQIIKNKLDIDYKELVKIAYDNQKHIHITTHPFEIKYLN